MGFHDNADIQALKKADIKYYLHPSSSIPELIEQGPKIITKAKDSKVYDIEGHEYIDGFAGLWYNNVGHGREEIIEAAAEQMRTLDTYHSFQGFSNVPAIELAQKISAMVPVPEAKVFFTSGGSETNDTIFKLVRYYWYARGMDSKDYIISRKRGYHGLTYSSAQATRLPGYHEGFEPLPPGFDAIDVPHCYQCPWGKEYPHCSLECATALEEKIKELGEDRVAAFVAEPVLGAGGVIVPPPEYYPQIREICNRHNVLFVADEVITGFGRTGTNFGIEQWNGVVPDVMALAKGITSGYVPLGAAVFSDEIYQALKTKDKLFHGFTYSGHPLACRVALKNIEILEKENLKENAQKMGAKLVAGLKALNEEAVGEVRGKGLMVGVELVKNGKSKEKYNPPLNQRVFEIAYENGVIVRPLNGDVIALSPPLIITNEEIDQMVEVLGEAIAKACKER